MEIDACDISDRSDKNADLAWLHENSQSFTIEYVCYRGG